MSIDLTSHAGYEAAKATYDGALTAARAATDEAAEAKAEAAWARAQMGMVNEVVASQQATAARELSLARIKAQYPGVPEALYTSIQDPEAMEASAKQAHEWQQGWRPSSPPPGQQPQQQWTPPPGQGNPPPPPPENALDDVNVYREKLAAARSNVNNRTERKEVIDYNLAQVFGNTAQNLTLNRVHPARPRDVEY